MATMKEIADRANVSIGTVSRVLNNDSTLSVSPQTRSLILQIADELDYRVKKKSPRKKHKIAVVYLYDDKYEAGDPYYLTIRLHLNDALKAHKLDYVTYFGGIPDAIRQEGFNGLILVGNNHLWKWEYDRLLQSLEIPVVFVDFHVTGLNYDYIAPDLWDAMYNCMDYLFGLGYRKIGYIGKWEPNVTGHYDLEKNPRKDAFLSYMEKMRLLNKDWLYLHHYKESETNPEIGFRLAERAIRERELPEAFVVENDSIAIGVINCFQKMGIAIPGDIGIVSSNDDPNSAFLSPPLSTVKIHNELMGEKTVELLLERIKDPEKWSYGCIIPCELMVRDTLRPVSGCSGQEDAV